LVSLKLKLVKNSAKGARIGIRVEGIIAIKFMHHRVVGPELKRSVVCPIVMLRHWLGQYASVCKEESFAFIVEFC